MKYSKKIPSKTYPFTFDKFDEIRGLFHEEFKGYTKEKRLEIIKNVNRRFFDSIFDLDENDSVLTEPTDKEIDMIFWEIVKADLRVMQLHKEIPKVFEYALEQFILHNEVFSDYMFTYHMFDMREKEMLDLLDAKSDYSDDESESRNDNSDN